MSRLIFPKGKQKEFLTRNRLNLSRKNIDIAKVCRVHPRTLFDWERGKFNMSSEAAVRLEKMTGIAIPKAANFRQESWNCSNAGRLGAIARYKLYGNPGTYAGRSKGGRK